ncbi:hypothetical protein [Fimbriiglobus ruber]|uniref:hypothetical protein n=1 Tax=Fimbriiglobus ruber TaxID=1908690 RepID=UPI000B4B7A5A|nr:hypothetical protein [Fimbriiglobus ruber]
MLRTTVLVRRKAHGDRGTASYGITLNGEIPFGTDDSEGVLEKIAELFHLADEALTREIERGQDSPPVSRPEAIPQRPADPPLAKPATPRSPDPRPEPATSRQAHYVQNLVKRIGLSQDELQAIIARVTGSPKKLGDLTKRDAGLVIDHLNTLTTEPARG